MKTGAGLLCKHVAFLHRPRNPGGQGLKCWPFPIIQSPGQGLSSRASQFPDSTQVQEEGGPRDEGSFWFLVDPTWSRTWSTP